MNQKTRGEIERDTLLVTHLREIRNGLIHIHQELKIANELKLQKDFVVSAAGRVKMANNIRKGEGA